MCPRTFLDLDSTEPPAFHPLLTDAVSQARPPNADLYTDSDLVRADVSSLVRAGRTVVAIMCSYGG
jgi:hypothetical protein